MLDELRVGLGVLAPPPPPPLGASVKLLGSSMDRVAADGARGRVIEGGGRLGAAEGGGGGGGAGAEWGGLGAVDRGG